MRFRYSLVAFSALLALSSASASLLPYQSRTALLLTQAPDNFVGLRPYEQNYLMETFSNKNYNYPENMRHDEIKFQISVALPLWKDILGKNSVLAGSYTQRSWFSLVIEVNPRHSVKAIINHSCLLLGQPTMICRLVGNWLILKAELFTFPMDVAMNN